MSKTYSSEKNVQILVRLMKEHSIKKIVISPGATNVSFVASVQNDDYFEIYSAADERSAAYIACGLAEESGEPVAISCTAATSSRNYMPALTEAFYRKIPILAITSIPPTGRVGHNFPQMLDRSVVANDIVKMSVELPVIYDEEEEWSVNTSVNEALLELTHNGKGPVHINLTTAFKNVTFDVENLPETRVIRRIGLKNNFPSIDAEKVAIFCGAHSKWSESLTKEVDTFCEKYNGVVLCDQTSNYQGKYGVMFSLITFQEQYYSLCRDIDLMIDMGNISGAYMNLNPKKVWRVNIDGKIRDSRKKLECIFDMEEEDFFKKYNTLKDTTACMIYYDLCKAEYESIYSNIPELPFSNIWVAKTLASKLPVNSTLHLAILNSLRSWNFFEKNKEILAYSNTGGFGIDGGVSTIIGASLVNPNKNYIGIVGDLAFFYDMNALGNRHIGPNLRLLVVNNGLGMEFKNYSHQAAQFEEQTEVFMAAGGHYGNKSKQLLKNYAENLGFEYITASSKEEFMDVYEAFVSPEIKDKPMIFEIFTEVDNESLALKTINNTIQAKTPLVKKVAKDMLGEDGIKNIKKILGRQ